MSNKKFKILVADDEVDLVELIVGELSGYAVFTAYNGQDAFDIIRKEKPNLVISDINMPKILGLDCLDKTKRLGLDIPFVFITGFNDGEYLKKAWDLGAFDFLDKPIDLDQLQNVVKMAYLYSQNPPELFQQNNIENMPTEKSTVVLELEKTLIEGVKTAAEEEGIAISQWLEILIREKLKVQDRSKLGE